MTNSDIASRLVNEGILVRRKTVWAFLLHYKRTNTVCRMPGSVRPSKATDQAVLSLEEELMQKDNETTALQLHHHLEKNGVSISLPTVLRSRQKLGWTFRGTHYCQMIREVNKSKRLEWAREYLHDDFNDVVWTDEMTVQLDSHKCYCCRKQGAAPKPKPRPKHPLKVHVWVTLVQMDGRNL